MSIIYTIIFILVNFSEARRYTILEKRLKKKYDDYKNVFLNNNRWIIHNWLI